MTKKKIVIRMLVFALLFLGIFIVSTEVLKDKRVELEYDVTSKVKGFYAEPKDSLDFVFVGSSQLYADISPNVLFRDFGITSYDFCANEQPLWISYYYIKEALKYQKPKAIILDVFTVYGKEYEQEGVNHINLDDLPFSINKLKAIHASVPKELRTSFYMELIKYHSTWDALDEAKIRNSFYHKNNPYKGYSPFIVRKEYLDVANEEVVNQSEKQPIEAMSLEWLEKIVELTASEGVDLLLIKTPNGNADRQKYYLSVADFAKENNIPFLNMNTILDGEAHINLFQAEKVTDYLGNYLCEHYQTEDKRSNPAFENWKSDGLYFEHKKRRLQLISCDDLTEYEQLLKESYESAYPGYELSQNTGLYIFKCVLGEDGKCESSILYNQDVLLSQSDMESFDVSTQINGETMRLSYDINSEERRTGLWFGDNNYSLDYEGVNYFVYDPLTGEVVDFVSFDLKDDMKAKREKNRR